MEKKYPEIKIKSEADRFVPWKDSLPLSKEKKWDRYQLEKSLADRLKQADKRERSVLYTTVYNKLFRELPDLKVMQQKADQEKWNKPSPQLKWLKRILSAEKTFMDIGAGNCKLALEATNFARQVFAVEASSYVSRQPSLPPNFKLIVGDATTVELTPETVDVAYTHHVIERLHPEDALKHLENVRKLLTAGGIYFCITPNRIFGPHDASRNYDPVATGLHLKEYSYAELDKILRQSGFSKTRIFIRIWGNYLMIPTWPMKIYEFIMSRLPYFLRLLIGKWPIFKPLANIRLIAKKY